MSLSYQEFISLLQKNSDLLLTFYLPDKQKISEHFHLTEVGFVQGNFVDCGGVGRIEKSVQLQLWLGKDKAHFINPEAFLKILKIVEQKNPDATSYYNKKLLIEYDHGTVIRYEIGSYQIRNGYLEFFLTSQKTECRAMSRAACGQKQSACC